MRDAGSSSHVLAGDGELLGCLLGCLAAWLEEGYLQTALSRPGPQPPAPVQLLERRRGQHNISGWVAHN